jgi:hypothetical protein
MRRPSSWLLISAIAFGAGCTSAGDKRAEAPGADTMAAEAPGPSGPMAIATVLYNTPKDTAVERYYAETHLPLVTGSQGEIGFERAELTRFQYALVGVETK